MTVDPLPWCHVSGTRAPDPHSADAPRGGYTWSPRHGYSDHDTRFRSTRHRDECRACDLPPQGVAATSEETSR